MLNMISKTINVKCCSSHFYHQPPYVWRDSNISQHFRARTCRSQALEIIDCKWLEINEWTWIFCLLFLTNHLQLPKTNFQRTTQIGLTCQQLQPRITKTSNYISIFLLLLFLIPLLWFYPQWFFLQSPQVSLHSSKPDVIFWASYRAVRNADSDISAHRPM